MPAAFGASAPVGMLERAWLMLPARLRRRIARFELDNVTLPRGTEAMLGALFLGATIAYGASLGGQMETVSAETARLASKATAALGFRITAVKLSGQRESDEETILAYLGVMPASSLLIFDAEAARQRIAEIPWVKTAAVQKLYPGTLIVTMTERQPFALWQHDGKVSIIDDTGRVIDDGEPSRFAHLPLIVGEGAQGRAADIVAMIATYPALADRLKAAVLVADRRWNLLLQGGVEVRLPEEGASEALARLDRLDREDHIFGKDIAAIDLRFEDRLIVRLTDEATARRAESAKGGAAVKPRRRSET
ncbi:MAG: cell division protein FtsQ/DivIB [Hyphomicrobiales bacterium]